MMSLVNKVKEFFTSKLLTGAVIVLATLLIVTHIDNNQKTAQIEDLRILADRSVQQNKRLNEQLEEMRTELETKPPKQIEVVKEVMTEVCNGRVLEVKINSLPSKREVGNEVPKQTADIDDRLPDDLRSLLK